MPCAHADELTCRTRLAAIVCLLRVRCHSAELDRDVLPLLLSGDGPGLDDVEILPTLRNATCVPQLNWPKATKQYVEETCAKAKVATYF